MKIKNSIFASIAINLIRFYQLAISPLMGSNCRFQPTCSAYTLEAIEQYGFGKGAWIGAKRIGRCHPWGGSGKDPVPKKVKNKNK